MTITDRSRIKQQQEGQFLTAGGMTDGKLAVRHLHSRGLQGATKTGTENAATNVAQTPALGYQFRKVKVRGIGITTFSNIATNNTSYNVFKFYKTVAGTSTLIGSWNTHGGAQGAITLGTPAVIAVGTGLITNSDAEIAVGASIDYVITKVSAGQLVDPGMLFDFDLEEI